MWTAWLKNWSHRKPVPKKTSTRLGVEVLEDRCVPSASALPDPSWGDRVVSGDFDGDGRADLFFWNPESGVNRVDTRFGTHNGTPNTFELVREPISIAAINGNEFTQVVVGDFDGDRHDDLYFWNPATGANALAHSFRSDNSVPFFTVNKNVSNPVGINYNEYLQVVAGNFDGAGGDDLFFWNPTTGANRMEFLGFYNGNRAFGNILQGRVNPLSVNGNVYSQVVVGDFDGDRRDDLYFWHSHTGANQLAHSFGNYNGIPWFATQQSVSNPAGINGSVYTRVVAANVNASGGDDLFFWNPTTGENRLEFLGFYNGNRYFGYTMQNQIDPRSLNGKEYLDVVSGDLNNDRRGDLFFWNPVTGNNQLAHSFVWNNGVATFTTVQNMLAPGAISYNQRAVHVTGSPRPDSIILSGSAESGFTISLNGAIWYLPGSYPAQFIVHGLAGGDVIENRTGIASTLYGGDGDDTLNGGSGNDYLYGENGNDLLFGDLGNDYLDGGYGDDRLFGGYGRDILVGGPGMDRFLRRPGDDIVDQRDDDAEIRFEDKDRVWTQAEILGIDKAFAVLQNRTGNTRLLKLGAGAWNWLTGDHLTFWRVSAIPKALADNNSRGDIRFSDAAFQGRTEKDIQFTVFHEIGHNWDDFDENSYIGQFRSLSGWTQTNPGSVGYKSVCDDGETWWYKGDATFLRDYSASSPYEDFADAFAAYITDSGVSISQKTSFIDQWLNTLRGS